MSISRLIESLGLSAHELRRYVVAELDEFLDAEDPAAKEEEFGDLLFSLMSLGWAHSGRHFRLDPSTFETKLKQRLRTYGAVTRHPRRYTHDRIPELPFGVVHFAFGQFAGQWKTFDPLKNGTVAEITLLTDAPFNRAATPTNHCIVTFDDTQSLEYEFLHAASEIDGGNTVLCRIPNFLYARAKEELAYGESGEYMALQVMAALDGLRIVPGGFAHFHSWESGFLADSSEFLAAIAGYRTLFSPYLTIGPLRDFIEASGGCDWTMTPRELSVAAAYEQKLGRVSERLILESDRDRTWYQKHAFPCLLDVRSFSAQSAASFASDPQDERHLTFIAGGRPVREKGFLELCREFAGVRDWAVSRGLTVSLAIICREPRADKGAQYIAEIERAIADLDLCSHLTIEAKVSLDVLRRRIARASALVVPSLHDPFCLMPTYSMEGRRPAFVSTYAGVSENILTRDFVFDPLVRGDLARAVAAWYEKRPPFQYESRFPNYDSVYLDEEAR